MENKNIVIAKSKVCGNSVLLKNVVVKKFCAWCNKTHDFVIKDAEELRENLSNSSSAKAESFNKGYEVNQT